jgi:putative oxidoreductase
MERILGRCAPYFYAFLRIVAGFLFACHGAQKLFGLFGGQQVMLNSQAGLAGVIELVAGVMIAVGFFTSFAAFIASGEMAYAYFMIHSPNGRLPIRNGGELSALYSFIFLYMSARGTGVLGIDRGSKSK